MIDRAELVKRNFKRHQEWMRDHLQKLEKEGVKVFKISTTEREEFKRCRRRWDFSSLSRKGLEPKKASIPLWFGTGIHYGLEKYYSGQGHSYEHFAEWADKQFAQFKEKLVLYPEQIKELEDMKELGVKMLEGYETWAAVEDFHPERGFKQVLHTEVEFQTPILDEEDNPLRFTDARGQVWELHLVGRLDLVVEDFDGRIWLMDHKTSKDKLDPEILILNDQMTVYLWAAQQVFGVRFEGALYNVLRKKLPTVPRVLANGKGLSKDKSIDTTYEVYLQAIHDNGFNEEDYQDILQHLQNKPNTFYQRERIRRNQYEIAMAGYMLRLEGIDMLNDPFIYTNATWDCRWDCDFVSVCKAMNRNDDWQWMLDTMFQKRQPGEGSVYARERTDE